MDAEKLSQLTQKVIGDAAGAVGLLLAYIGDQSKVYTTMDELGPSSVKEIADKAGLDERYFCLLYTSPSPRDVEEARMPSSA